MPHTPGPWLHGKAGMDKAIYADHEQGFDIATVRNGGNDRQVEANAKLIAAAPDLLAALQRFMELNAKHGYEFDSNEPELYLFMADAIKKATA